MSWESNPHFVDDDESDVQDDQPETGSQTSSAAPGELGKRDSQATVIVRLVQESGGELWHTPAGDSYISVTVGQHCEHYPLVSRRSKDFLTRLYYKESAKAPNASALQDAIATLSGIARFDGDEYDVHVRIAGGEDHIYLDLGDPDWQMVEITPSGWRLVADAPVRFRRPRGVQPLPLPVRGGSLQELRPFLNVASDDDFVLLVMWELAALRHRGPYPILIFMAEHGSAKTTTMKVLKRLGDPNESDVRRPPRNTEDLMIAAVNSHVVAFDNLSWISDELSDNLSVLATGGGFAVRQLYTNSEEMIFNVQRPVMLNGIAQVATRGDLLDRALVLTLPPIPDERRKDEDAFWAAFDTAHPRLLGVFLDALVMGLRRIRSVQLPRKPRMADFALWGVATEPACPWPAGTFLEVYAGNRQGATEAALDGEPVADLARALVSERGSWDGTAGELLAELNKRTPEDTKKRKDWIAKPRQVADALRRLAPALRKVGVNVLLGDGKNSRREAHTGRRIITIEKVGAASSPSSPSSPDPETPGQSGDARSDASRGSSPSSPAASPETPNNTGTGDAGDAGDARQPAFSGRAVCCEGGNPSARVEKSLALTPLGARRPPGEERIGRVQAHRLVSALSTRCAARRSTT